MIDDNDFFRFTASRAGPFSACAWSTKDGRYGAVVLTAEGELENAVERAMILHRDEPLRFGDLGASPRARSETLPAGEEQVGEPGSSRWPDHRPSTRSLATVATSPSAREWPTSRRTGATGLDRGPRPRGL
jgi:hypothetical protein